MPNTDFIFRYKEFTLENIPGDVKISLLSYLADSSGTPFIDADTGGIDTFEVNTLRSSLPGSGYADFLKILADSFISEVYTSTLSGDAVTGNTVITGISSTSDLVPGQSVAAAILLTGDLTSGSNEIANVSSTVSLAAGMAISGVGIPSGTTVLSVDDTSTITMSSLATASGTGVTLTFKLLADGTIINSIRSSTSISLSNSPTATINTFDFVFGTENWNVDYTAIDELVTIVNFNEL